jgi:hypothetical protein
VCVCNS